MNENPYIYGRKYGGVWHLVDRDCPRAMCHQWTVATELSEERPEESHLCRRCFRLPHTEESRKFRDRSVN